MKRSVFVATLVVLALAAGALAPLAAADEPPITVPTPTTPSPDPSPPRSKPKPQPAPKRQPSPPRSSTPRPVTPQPTYTPPAAAPRVTPLRPSTRAKHAKKPKPRPKAAHKPKRTKPAVKPAPKAPVVKARSHPTQTKSAVLGATARESDREWLRWTLLLAATTGLMGLSLAALIGTARNPARAATRAGRGLRLPQRGRIREVIPERIEHPLPAATAAVALPGPARPVLRPPALAPEPVEVPVAPPPAPVERVEAPQAPLPAPAPSAQGPPPAEPEVIPEPTEEICEILVWRGYAKARFYARLDLDQPDEFAIAESPSFRFHGNGYPDDTDTARAAHRALVEKLVAKGWEKEETGGPWYAARFRRPLERSLY